MKNRALWALVLLCCPLLLDASPYSNNAHNAIEIWFTYEEIYTNPSQRRVDMMVKQGMKPLDVYNALRRYPENYQAAIQVSTAIAHGALDVQVIDELDRYRARGRWGIIFRYPQAGTPAA